MRAAAAPVANSTNNRDPSSFFISLLARGARGAPTTPFCVLRSIEIVLQKDRGGCGIELRLALAPVLLATRQAALRFHARQPLVLRGDRQRRPRFQPRH